MAGPTLYFLASEAYFCSFSYKTSGYVAIPFGGGEVITLTITADDFTTLVLTEGHGLTVTRAAGVVLLSLTEAQTESLRGKCNREFSLDLETTDVVLVSGKLSRRRA